MRKTKEEARRDVAAAMLAAIIGRGPGAPSKQQARRAVEAADWLLEHLEKTRPKAKTKPKAKAN